MKSTLAKLCGVGIVYLIFLLTEIEEEEINAALKRMLILLDQVNDLSKSAK
jgi:hypothetical protein